jgi:hypothetical protein
MKIPRTYIAVIVLILLLGLMVLGKCFGVGG